MGIKLEKTTDPKLRLKLISVIDSAIDWDSSYQDPSDLVDDDLDKQQESAEELPDISVSAVVEQSLEKRKKAHYEKHHDESKLRFKEGDMPTLFVFHHPHRSDVSRKMRELASMMYADSQKGRKDRVERDMFSAVFHSFYLGREEGFGGELIPVQKINQRITDDAIQELEDAEVFIELNAAFMKIYNQDRTKLRDKERAEK